MSKILSFILIFLIVQNINAQDESIDSAFYEELIEKMKENYIDRELIDWEKLSEQVYKKSLISKDSAVYHALKILNNSHSFYRTKNGKIIKPTNKNHFQSLENRVGIISISKYSNLEDKDKNRIKAKKYINNTIDKIKQQDSLNLKYWIIDLRNNTGGNMWPMLVSLSPFYNDGILGYFKDGEEFTEWKMENGSIFSGKFNQTNNFLGEPINFKINAETIYVLINESTVSSGEAVVISLKSLKNVVFIGSKTGGYSTANRTFKLSNGDSLILTSSQMLDLNKVNYDDGITPNYDICETEDIVEFISKQIK